MARHYSVKDFFRQTPNALLARYFADRGLFADLNFSGMDEGKPDELFDRWVALPDEDRRRTDADFRDIDDMSNEKGWLAMLGEARFHLQNQQQVLGFIEAMAVLPNHHARAMTVYLDYADYWLGATRLRDVDSMSYWRKRKNLPKKAAAVDKASVARLAELIKAHFSKTDGRGKNCEVEVYRWGERDYFFAFPEDHAQHGAEWEDGERKVRPHNPAFDLVFVYSQADGTLELNCRGATKADEALQGLFAQAILGLDALPPDAKSKEVYDLGPLMKPNFEFTHAPDSGIGAVVVKRLRLTSRVRRGDQLVLSADTNRDRQAVYALAEEIGKAMPLHLFDVTQVELAATLQTDPGKKPKTVTIRITHPNSCSLKQDEVGNRLRMMLVASGIEPRAPACAERRDGAGL